MPVSSQRLRQVALSLAETDEGLACEGTPLETRTVRVRGKAFLFLKAADLRLKLGASLPDARRLEEQHPEALKVGSNGWVWVALRKSVVPPTTLTAWVRESHGLFAAGPRRSGDVQGFSSARRR